MMLLTYSREDLVKANLHTIVTACATRSDIFESDLDLVMHFSIIFLPPLLFCRISCQDAELNMDVEVQVFLGSPKVCIYL